MQYFSLAAISAYFLTFTSVSFAQSDPRLNNIAPDSPIEISLGGNFTSDGNFSLSGSAWASGYGESHVFRHLIEHDNANNSYDWELRVGKGGQMFSFRTDGVEITPPQFRGSTDGPPGYESDVSPWNDDVFQVVTLNTILNSEAKAAGLSNYFMHGAGVYLRDHDYLVEPFYNPKIAEGATEESNSYMTVNWMVQAHAPSVHPSHAIAYSQYRDVGEGILEVTTSVYNYADNDLNYFNLPWGGVRTSNYGVYNLIELNEDTGIREEKYVQTGAWGPDANNLSPDNTDGWMVFTEPGTTSGRAVGLAFPLDQVPLPSYQAGSLVRYAFSGGVTSTKAEDEWRNQMVFSNIKQLDVPVGSGMWARWYFVVGERSDVISRIENYDLVAKSEYGLLDIQPSDADIINWYGKADGPVSQYASSGPLLFSLYAQPVNGSVPIFKLTAANGEVFMSDSPTALTEPYEEDNLEYIRPYDQKTSDWELMGYAMLAGNVVGQAPSGYLYQRLSKFLTPAALIIKDAPVVVLTTSEPNPVYTHIKSGHSTYLRQIGSEVEQSQSAEGLSKEWRFIDIGGDQYTITNKFSGDMLSASSATEVGTIPSNGTTAETEKWTLIRKDGDFDEFYIQNVYYSQRLIGYPSSHTESDAVKLDSQTKAGIWTQWEAETATPEPVDNNLLSGHSTYLRQVGSSAVLSDTSNGSSKEWRFVPVGNNQYTITNNFNDHLLSAISTIEVSVVAPGGTTGDSEKWVLVQSDSDFDKFHIQNVGNGQRLIGYPPTASESNAVKLVAPTNIGIWVQWEGIETNL